MPLSVPSSPLGNDVDRALSEAGSLEDLNTARQSILSQWDTASTKHDDATRALLRARVEERAAILRQEARQRLANQLTTSPFHASLNAPSPTVVDFCVAHPDVLDIDSHPLPYDGAAWAAFWTDFARSLDVPEGPVSRAAAEYVAALNTTVTVAGTPTVASPLKPRRGSWHVAVVGRRGVGRGALFQCLTGAGALSDSDKVGARLLPVAYVHCDEVTVPTMDASEVRRVWAPIRAAVADVLVKKPLMAAALLSRSDTKTTHASLGAPEWATRTSPVTGAELEALVKYANDMLLALHSSSGASVDQLVLDTLFGSLGPLRGPARIRSRFPWLRGLPLPVSFVDAPVPEPGLGPFLAQTLQSVLSGAATTVYVDRPRWEGGYATTTSITPGGVVPPARHLDPSGAVATGDDEAVWKLLREYLDSRKSLGNHSSNTSSARWDSDLATPLHIVISNDASAIAPALPPQLANNVAAIAVEYSLWITRHRNATVKPHHVYVISPKAANAVIGLHDEVCRRSASQDDYDTQATGEVASVLAAVAEQADWRRLVESTSVGGGSPVQIPTDVCELLVTNEVVWRLSHAGFLIQAVLHEVVACCTLPSRVSRLSTVHDTSLSLLRAITDAILAPACFTPESENRERKALDSFRDITSSVKEVLLEHKRHIELLLAEGDTSQRSRDSTASVFDAVQDIPLVGAALSTAAELKDDAAKKLYGARLSLASVIRTKVAAVTAMGKPSAGNTATPATGRVPPPVAVDAVNAVGARAASFLQGTSSDVAVVAEKLRAWWCRLPEDVRVGQSDGNSIVFRISGEECVLRLCFSMADLAEKFADNQHVRGNTEMKTIQDVLQLLYHNAALDGVLALKPLRSVTLSPWSGYIPPKPAAAIKFLLQEHTQHVAPGSGSRPSPTCLVVVDTIDAQCEKELRANLVAALAFNNEAIATLEAFESDVQVAAAAYALKRIQEGAIDVVVPAARGGTAPGSRWFPLGTALGIVSSLCAASGGLLSESFHVLSAALVRPDDAVAHLAMTGTEETARMMHCVSRLREFPAEWRRWRCDKYRQSSLFMREVATCVGFFITTAPGAALKIPGDVPLVEPTPSAPQSRDRSLLFDAVNDAASSISSLKASLTGALKIAPPAVWQVQGRKKAVMCLCGGGVRGVLSAMFVQRIDSIVQAKYSVPGKKRMRIWDVCDEFYGTSTGAIVAALLAIGVEPSAIVTLYKENSRQIFPPSTFAKVVAATKPKYDPAGRFEVAKRYMGRRVMNDAAVYAGIARPKVLLCDLTSLKTKVADCNTDMQFVDALMAATAAPTYFPAHKIGTKFYCDAGIAENHPGLEVAKDMRNVAYVCTIGTGVAPSNYQFLANAGLLQWGPVFADVFIDATQTAADDVLKTLFGDHSDLLNLTLPPVKMELDDAGTIPVLMDIALRYMDEKEDQFVKVADMLYSHTVGWRAGSTSFDE